MDIKRIIEVISIIKKNKYQAYLVGGSARDFIYSREFTDVDIATNAPVSFLSEKFEVINTDGKKFGSIKINYKGITMELTHFRKETYESDSIYPKMDLNITSPFDDASRRDFTINAIYLDVTNMQIIDPFDGFKDLFAFTLKFINDPKVRIKEDPTRIIRALRIAAKMNFKIEENSLIAIKENIKELDRITKSKLAKELSIMVNDLGIDKTKKILNEYGIEGDLNEN